ncbi:CU044_2847 family protein [Pseudanabaena minima]|uniref:CU044_2847 family protein n=1 Tax=Pseudanabaena minima TaxID=890415 RepID=UPI003DA960D9
MTSLTPLQIDENTIIYIEASEAVDVPTIPTGEAGLVTYGDTSSNTEKIRENFDRLKSTLTHYTLSTIDAFKKANNTDIANIDKVTLKFGIKIAGEAGIPYITKGTAESNLEITVECSFPKHQPTP